MYLGGIMKFECIRSVDSKKEIWNGEITSYAINNKSIDIYVQSRSSFHIIIGKSTYGNYVCVPNFNSSCYFSTFGDVFWNTERLVELIGEVDCITVVNAIKYVDKNLILGSF